MKGFKGFKAPWIIDLSSNFDDSLKLIPVHSKIIADILCNPNYKVIPF